MKKLAMISQPMAGRSTWEIDNERNRAIAELERRGYYVVNTFFTGAWHGKERVLWACGACAAAAALLAVLGVIF